MENIRKIIAEEISQLFLNEVDEQPSYEQLQKQINSLYLQLEMYDGKLQKAEHLLVYLHDNIDTGIYEANCEQLLLQTLHKLREWRFSN